MTDILLDATGDLAWSEGLISTVEGDDEILQRLWIALSTGLGEWAFDTSFGFPCKQVIARGKPLDRTFVEGAIRAVAEPIVGTGGITAINIVHDAPTQTLTISVDSIYGTVTAVY